MLATKPKTMSVSFQPSVFNQINSICAERGCTRSWLVNKAVEQFLKESFEDKDDYEIAVTAWKEYEKNGKSYSAQEVFAEAGL